MKCTTVRKNLAGYLDDALTGAARVKKRIAVREHLESCNGCRAELEKFRKLAVLLSRVPKNVPPADLVFVLVFQMIVPGITVRAVQNDVPINLMRPAELVSISDYPQSWAPEQHDLELSLPHGLLLDVTVVAEGHMTDYQIISGPSSPELRRQLDQMLLFSRFSPMLSFGRPTAGGHVVLSFSAVRVRG